MALLEQRLRAVRAEQPLRWADAHLPAGVLRDVRGGDAGVSADSHRGWRGERQLRARKNDWGGRGGTKATSIALTQNRAWL